MLDSPEDYLTAENISTFVLIFSAVRYSSGLSKSLNYFLELKTGRVFNVKLKNKMSEHAIDEFLYEIEQTFANYKLEQINAFSLSTNESGNEITICLYKFGAFSEQKLAYITEVLTAFVKYFDETNSWENFLFIGVIYVAEASSINLNKYTFSIKTGAELKLARKNFTSLTYIH